MASTTIEISSDTRSLLARYKYAVKAKSYDEAIRRLIKQHEEKEHEPKEIERADQVEAKVRA